MFTSHTGGGYFFQDDRSINLELIAGDIEIDESHQESLAVVGLDLLFRWFLKRDGPWSVYAEAGVGLHQSSGPFPTAGSHFNFRPQAGLGFTLDLDAHVKLMSGARWLHISNANKDGSKRNPGFDGGMIYSGIMVRF